MSEQDKCPKCGAKMREFIQCTEDGSVYHDHATDGNECLRRQLAQAQAERDNLKRAWDRERETCTHAVKDKTPLCQQVNDLKAENERLKATCVICNRQSHGESLALAHAPDCELGMLLRADNPGQPILDRLKTAEAIIAKLPKDAEDNPLAPGVVRWTMEGIEVRIGAIYDDGLQVAHVGHATILEDHSHDEEWDEYAYELYPTREAALAAKEKT